MQLSLTWEPKGPRSQPALPRALSMEKPVLHFSHEFVQLLPRGIDEQSPRFAEEGGFDPQRCPQGCHKSKGTHEA